MAGPSLNDYSDVAGVYIAMVPPETVQGGTTANPFIAKTLAELPEGAHVLDAACGNGFDAIAVANGLPDIAPTSIRRTFFVAASDASGPMIAQAKKNLAAFSHQSGENLFIDFRQSALADLARQSDWPESFDAVLIPNVIGNPPDNGTCEDYPAYLEESLHGAKAVLKRNGLVLVDSRDWEQTLARFASNPVTQRQNTHDGITYLTEYSWHFGNAVNALHTAEVRIWDNPHKQGPGARNTLRFAGMSTESLTSLFTSAGFTVTEQNRQERGLNREPFNTFVLRMP